MDEYRLNLVWDTIRRGQTLAAIDKLRELLAEDPNQAIYHSILAACLLSAKRIYAAEYELKIALNLDAQNAFTFYVYAQVCMFKNKHKQALKYCDEVLALNPEHYEALLLKGDIYMLLDRRENALENINAASRIAPNEEAVITAFGDFYNTIGDLDKALGYANEALRINPESIEANLLMGEVQLALGNVKEAEYHAKFVMSLQPESELALRLFSNIKMRNNFFMGLWWRANAKISMLGNIKGSFVLIFAYLFFNLASQVLDDFGYESSSLIVSYAWLIIVLYSWIAIPVYYRMLKSELDKFSFNRDF